MIDVVFHAGGVTIAVETQSDKFPNDMGHGVFSVVRVNGIIIDRIWMQAKGKDGYVTARFDQYTVKSMVEPHHIDVVGYVTGQIGYYHGFANEALSRNAQ